MTSLKWKLARCEQSESEGVFIAHVLTPPAANTHLPKTLVSNKAHSLNSVKQ